MDNNIELDDGILECEFCGTFFNVLNRGYLGNLEGLDECSPHTRLTALCNKCHWNLKVNETTAVRRYTKMIMGDS